MNFAPFASAAVHSMRCQPSVRAQYSAAARLRAGRVTLAADGDAGAHGQALGQAVARLLMPGVGT